ncbi:hypothetical protein AB0B12_08475 [Streptomyces sp. NPDC044780]|uniref:hypothetical protein n=1 Tax=unclassified Streptomyces TaxID=2593676 RepID=UPI003407CA71
MTVVPVIRSISTPSTGEEAATTMGLDVVRFRTRMFVPPAAGDRSSSAVAGGSAHGAEPAPERRPERRT